MVTYIVDDQDKDVYYLCPVAHKTAQSAYFDGTYSQLSSVTNSTCDDGWFMYSFNGQGVSVVAALTQNTSGAYRVALDTGVLSPQDSQGAYDSGVLLDGAHTLVYATGARSLFPTFDYLTVRAGESTQMRGRSVIVDDMEGEIVFSGAGWVPAVINAHKTYTYARGSYRDTIHWTGDVGESLEFEFVGTSVALYGLLPSTNAGNITLQYAVDGEFVSANVVANEGDDPMPMFRLMGANELAEGRHILTANVTDVQEAYAIGIDFVVYEAAFDGIGDSSSTSDPSTSPSATHGKHTNTGAIVGGVMGGLVFIAICMLVLFVTRRRQRRQQRSRAAAAVIGRNYNPQLDVKVVPSPRMTLAGEAYPMSTRA